MKKRDWHRKYQSAARRIHKTRCPTPEHCVCGTSTSVIEDLRIRGFTPLAAAKELDPPRDLRADEFVSLIGENVVDDLPEAKVRELLKSAIRNENARELARISGLSPAMLARANHLSRRLRQVSEEIDDAIVKNDKRTLSGIILEWDARTSIEVE